MKTIPLTRGHVAKVDDDDYERTSALKWSVHIRKRSRTPYAIHSRYVKGSYAAGKTKVECVQMHAFILGKPPVGMTIDHIDGDGLNNQKSNLRYATNSQNAANGRGVRTQSDSGLKGVHFHARLGKYEAYIRSSGSRKSLGCFSDPRDAARAYDTAAVAAFGEFAKTNASMGLV